MSKLKLSYKGLILFFLATLGLLMSFCVSKEQDRFPNSAAKARVSGGVDQVETSHGTLIVEWDNGESLDRSGNHKPAYAPVLVKISVVCKGSNSRTEIDSHNVCFYDGYHKSDEGGSIVSLGLRKQLKPVVMLRGSQLQVIPENDNSCNTPMIQTINMRTLCGG